MSSKDLEAEIQGEREKGRKSWDHPISFILAAVGSAVGLGNVWRFPYLVSKFGGAPFLIPYFIILFFVGMPILGMELCIGTFFQAGDADAFGSMNPRLRGIGLASIFAGYGITFYYCIILAWAFVYFGASFQATANIPWMSNTEDYFNEISMATGPDNFTGAFNWKAFVGLLAVWIIIFLCLFKGVKSTSWVVKFTVPLPLLILVVLIIRGAFLDGAEDGIMAYLIKWDSTVLSDPYIWSEAIGQVFFSLGVCMGVMTAYSSHNSKTNTNVAGSEKAISLSDTGIALLGGFAIYEMLGSMRAKCYLEAGVDRHEVTKETENEICEGYLNQKSFGLAFIAYPEGLGSLEAPQFWGIIFFGCLIMLGIDSAFSLCECMITFLKDCWIGLRYRPKTWIIAIMCTTVGLLAGLPYCFDSGLVTLDIVDRYINNWGMVLIGTLECFAVGWVYKIDQQYEKVGKLSVLIYNIGYLISLIVGAILAVALPYKPAEVDEAASLGVGLAIFIIGWVTSTCVAVLLSQSKPDVSVSSKLWAIMGWHGADDLRNKANNCVRNKEKDGVWTPYSMKMELQALYRHDCFSASFGFLIKYLSYTLLLVITVMNIKNDIVSPYENYPKNLLAIGQLIFVFMLFLVVIVAIFPRIMYDPFKYADEQTNKGRLKWMFTPKPFVLRRSSSTPPAYPGLPSPEITDSGHKDVVQ